MPVMPRVKGKATKIAWSILGMPLVFKKPSRTQKQRKEDQILSVQEQSRVR